MKLSGTVFIVDDEPHVAQSIAALVEALGCQSLQFGSAEAFLAEVSEVRPRCLVTDFRLPGISGLDLLQRLAKFETKIPSVLVSAYADTPAIVAAMRAGAVTVLDKPCSGVDLGNAVSEALMADTQNHHDDLRRAEFQRRMGSLSPQELQVLDRVVAGLSNKIIARQLDVSIRTIETRRHDILEKLAAKSMVELVQIVVRWQLGYSRDEPSACNVGPC